MVRSGDSRAAGAGGISVVYALAHKQKIVHLPFAAGRTARQAVQECGLIDEYPEIARTALVLAIYGAPIDPEYVPARGDRIEICRPLIRDPRDLRRYAVEQGAVMGALPPRKAKEQAKKSVGN